MNRRKFDTVFKSVAELFRIMSHPDRVRIIGLLHQHHELDVSHLQDALEISQSAVSQHLKLLKLNGLATERREGHHVYYRLQNKLIRVVIASAIEFQSQEQAGNKQAKTLLKEIQHILDASE